MKKVIYYNHATYCIASVIILGFFIPLAILVSYPIDFFTGGVQLANPNFRTRVLEAYKIPNPFAFGTYVAAKRKVLGTE